ncbi:hypothetical protein N9M39_00295 [Halieaceae bacterium]|nr:hypothetical protein [Halieaceae bacterium]
MPWVDPELAWHELGHAFLIAGVHGARRVEIINNGAGLETRHHRRPTDVAILEDEVATLVGGCVAERVIEGWSDTDIVTCIEIGWEPVATTIGRHDARTIEQLARARVIDWSKVAAEVSMALPSLRRYLASVNIRRVCNTLRALPVGTGVPIVFRLHES